MAFADHLTQERRTGGTGLLVDAHLAAMDETEASDARTLLASPLSDRRVAQAFESEGFPLSRCAVDNWRRANKVGRYQA